MVLIGFAVCDDADDARHAAGIRLRDRMLALAGLAGVPLGVSERGRPYLIGGKADFSVSHSGGAVMVGVCAPGAVPPDLPADVQGFADGAVSIGVDIERVDETAGARCRRIATRFFSPAEQAMVAAVDDPGAFYAVWTQKEAWLKMKGDGLSRLSHADTARLPDSVKMTGGEAVFGGERYKTAWCVQNL